MALHTYATLSARDTGHDDGRQPIVLLAGLTFDHRVWDPVVEAVRAADPVRRVVAIDLPGHGRSPAQPPHDLPRVAQLVHDALQAAGVTAPVVVGHSIAGALATIYAARYDTAAVVNVDQPPVVAPFIELVRRLEPQLRGSDFDRIWRDVFAASFHTELLEPRARRLVELNSRPSPDLVLSYWQMVVDRPAEETEALVDASLAEIDRRRIPYLLLLGSDVPSQLAAQLRARCATLEIDVWPGTGHFPHLAQPREFADLLARVGAGQLHSAAEGAS